MNLSPRSTQQDPDTVSVSCDDGAHERCPGCACHCHAKDVRSLIRTGEGRAGAALTTLPGLGGPGKYPTPGVGDDAVPSGDPNLSDVGSPPPPPPHAHLDDL